jgi:AcrR family transcriptional regulator
VRSDGAETRQHILQVAGRIFADRGFARATSREICQTAGTNMAAVNYHFGGKDALYDAVLVEAHGQLVRLDDLEAISASKLSREAKLRTLIGLFVRRSSGPALPWGLSVLVHELMAPSAHVPVLMREAVLPKVQVIASLIAQVLGVPDKHPLVQRSLALVALPCIMLVIAPQEVIREVMPTLAANPDALIDDMTAYAMAGLAAIRRLDSNTAKVLTRGSKPRRP